MIKEKEACNYYYEPSNINFQNLICSIEYNDRKQIPTP